MESKKKKKEEEEEEEGFYPLTWQCVCIHFLLFEQKHFLSIEKEELPEGIQLPS